ncbi:hypothetical protein AX16_005313 [Volvariella volvacea WC 439]|nr:hypothetical protein AX16_005313 [Volvariella volvacea WC 439]
MLKFAYALGDAERDDTTAAASKDRKGDKNRSLKDGMAGYLRQLIHRQPRPTPKPNSPHTPHGPNAHPLLGPSHNTEAFNGSHVTLIGGRLTCNSITVYLTPSPSSTPHR